MTPSPSRASVALAFALVTSLTTACGQIEEDPSLTAAPGDIANPDSYLPFGSYAVTTRVVSCDVDDRFTAGHSIVLHRGRRDQEPGFNLPIPWRSRTDPDKRMVRQDFKLPAPSFEDRQTGEEAGCSGGTLVRRARALNVSETQLVMEFTDETIDCANPPPSCTREVTYVLAERACAIGCNPTRVVTRGVFPATTFDCTCSAP